MESCIIQISDETLKQLSSLKLEEGEDYDMVIRRLLDDFKDNFLTNEEKEEIKKGLHKIAAGETVLEEDLLKEFGIE